MDKVSDELNKSLDRIDALAAHSLETLDRLSWRSDLLFGITLALAVVLWVAVMIAAYRARSSTG